MNSSIYPYVALFARDKAVLVDALAAKCDPLKCKGADATRLCIMLAEEYPKPGHYYEWSMVNNTIAIYRGGGYDSRVLATGPGLAIKQIINDGYVPPESASSGNVPPAQQSDRAATENKDVGTMEKGYKTRTTPTCRYEITTGKHGDDGTVTLYFYINDNKLCNDTAQRVAKNLGAKKVKKIEDFT